MQNTYQLYFTFIQFKALETMKHGCNFFLQKRHCLIYKWAWESMLVKRKYMPELFRLDECPGSPAKTSTAQAVNKRERAIGKNQCMSTWHGVMHMEAVGVPWAGPCSIQTMQWRWILCPFCNPYWCQLKGWGWGQSCYIGPQFDSTSNFLLPQTDNAAVQWCPYAPPSRVVAI